MSATEPSRITARDEVRSGVPPKKVDRRMVALWWPSSLFSRPIRFLRSTPAASSAGQVFCFLRPIYRCIRYSRPGWHWSCALGAWLIARRGAVFQIADYFPVDAKLALRSNCCVLNRFNSHPSPPVPTNRGPAMKSFYGSVSRPFRPVFLFYVFAASAAPQSFAQTIRVDAAPSHSTNTIRPTEALGAGIDRLPYGAADKLYVEDTIKQVLSAGWQTVTYRQNTELHMEAWHWNPQGTWSDPSGKGYFTGNPTPGTEMIRHSYGYPLPHRGVTRDDGTDTVGYSRLTDGDLNTYWKSNPYLTKAFTGEDDSLHPQWIFFDLDTPQMVDTIRIAWADPYATDYEVQFFTGDDPIRAPNRGLWQTFPFGSITHAKGGAATIRLASSPMPVRWVRIWMTESSNTCDSHGSSDKRNCVGYAIREISMGTIGDRGELHDLLRHTPDQDQTPTYCSSVDPWHEPSDIDRS